jgi:hypothetical protein
VLKVVTSYCASVLNALPETPPSYGSSSMSFWAATSVVSVEATQRVLTSLLETAGWVFLQHAQLFVSTLKESPQDEKDVERAKELIAQITSRREGTYVHRQNAPMHQPYGYNQTHGQHGYYHHAPGGASVVDGDPETEAANVSKVLCGRLGRRQRLLELYRVMLNHLVDEQKGHLNCMSLRNMPFVQQLTRRLGKVQLLAEREKKALASIIDSFSGEEPSSDKHQRHTSRSLSRSRSEKRQNSTMSFAHQSSRHALARTFSTTAPFSL